MLVLSCLTDKKFRLRKVKEPLRATQLARAEQASKPRHLMPSPRRHILVQHMLPMKKGNKQSITQVKDPGGSILLYHSPFPTGCD